MARNFWTEEESQWIIDNYTELGPEKCATYLNRPKSTIVTKAYKLSIKVKKYHNFTKHKYYKLWKNIKDRCINKKSKGYKYYGGRGIIISDLWINDPVVFIKYIEDNLGDCPESYSLDRIDNKKGYIPNNLRWASPIEQSANRRTTKLNPKKVSEIKKRLSKGETTQSIAKDYKVNDIVIYKIKCNQTWKYVL